MKILILILLITPCLLFAQTQKQLINYADQNAKSGDFYGASIYYKKALDIDSSDIDLLYKYANSLRLYNNYDLSAYYYRKITEKDKGGRIYKDAWFWLASMEKYNADYRNSIKTWKKVKSLYKKDKKSYEYLKSIQESLSCSYAMRSQHDSTEKCTITHLPEGINTTDSEFSGFGYHDSIIFSSLRADTMDEELTILSPDFYNIRIYSASGPYENVKTTALDSSINSSGKHNANGCFNTKGDKFYFTRCDTLNACEIYFCSYINSNWGKAEKLSSKINEKGSNTTQPNIAEIEGKEYLFFSSNRSGGKGNLDIWYAEVLDANTFSSPVNAGGIINTPDPEISAYYNNKENTLYFSSSWHAGFGGFDIFKSKGTPGNFQSPENLLQPVNSSCNDFYYTLNNNGSSGYLTSNRKGVLFKKGPTCCNDIWKVEYEVEEQKEELKIETLDDLNKYLPVTLYFHNDRPGPRSLDTIVPISYMIAYNRYKALQPEYRVEYSKGLDDEKAIDAQLDIDDFFKHYVDKGVSDLELFTKLLLEELNKGEKIEVTVKGFASPLAKTDYNVNLTKRRISSLINYLKEYGTGEFNAYMNKSAENGGELTFVRIPFGEYTASGSVSDDYYDQRNSIYNRSAALERKIEIQTVRKADHKDSIYAEMNIEMSSHDFGKLKQGEVVTHTFIIKNTGNKDLLLHNVISSCGCSSVIFEDKPIPPGEKTEITVTFDTKGLSGKQVKSITITADAFPTTKRLVITGEIF